MISQAFINYLPGYLIIISIITLFTCLSITIRYSMYYISENMSFKEYIKSSLNEPFGSFIEYVLFTYGIMFGLCTLSYVVIVFKSLDI